MAWQYGMLSVTGNKKILLSSSVVACCRELSKMSGWQFPQWNYGYTQMPGYYLAPPHAGVAPGMVRSSNKRTKLL